MKEKYVVVLLLALALLTACGKSALADSASSGAVPAVVQPQETPAPNNADEARLSASEASAPALDFKTASQNELKSLLDTMEQEVTSETPGSHTNTVRIAAALMNWGVGTTLTPDEVRAVTLDWLVDKGDAEGAAIHDKFSTVDAVCGSLLGDGGAQVLAQADIEDAAYPWSDEPLEPVEAIMNAVGLR